MAPRPVGMTQSGATDPIRRQRIGRGRENPTAALLDERGLASHISRRFCHFIACPRIYRKVAIGASGGSSDNRRQVGQPNPHRASAQIYRTDRLPPIITPQAMSAARRSTGHRQLSGEVDVDRPRHAARDLPLPFARGEESSVGRIADIAGFEQDRRRIGRL